MHKNEIEEMKLFAKIVKLEEINTELLEALKTALVGAEFMTEEQYEQCCNVIIKAAIIKAEGKGKK